MVYVLTFSQLVTVVRSSLICLLPFLSLPVLCQHQNTFLKASISSCIKEHCFTPDSNSLSSCDSPHYKCSTGYTTQMRNRTSLQKDQVHSVFSQLLMKLSQSSSHMFLYLNWQASPQNNSVSEAMLIFKYAFISRFIFYIEVSEPYREM